MNRTPLSSDQLRGVFAVPPLARRNDSARSIDFEQNDLIVKHIHDGGITRLIYGGNAFLYHVTLAEFEALLKWLSGISNDLWLIPSVGPSFGRAMDQAPLLRRHGFNVAMMLPCADPRDAAGLERGYREFVSASGCKLIVYLKDESNFGQIRTPDSMPSPALSMTELALALSMRSYAMIRRMIPISNPCSRALIENTSSVE